MIRLRWFGIYMLCFGTVLFVRLALWVTTYQKLRTLIVRPCPAEVDEIKIVTVARAVSAVQASARLIPKASCLTRAISCQAILSWKSIPTTISIGAQKDGASGMRAHAWLVWNDEVIMDGNEEGFQSFGKLLELPTPTSLSP